MRLIHTSQIPDLHLWCPQERADWLYDYVHSRSEGAQQLARQRRHAATITALYEAHDTTPAQWWAQQALLCGLWVEQTITDCKRLGRAA